jgi:hypothetical protein
MKSFIQLWIFLHNGIKQRRGILVWNQRTSLDGRQIHFLSFSVIFSVKFWKGSDQENKK